MSADFGELFNATRSALDDILGKEGQQKAQQRPAYETYFSGLGGPFASSALYDPAQRQGQQVSYGGPFAAQALYGRADLAQGTYGIEADPLSSNWFWQANQGARQARAQADAQKAQQAPGVSGTAVEAGDWSGPATADDNATLDGNRVESFIRSKNADSPLLGKGQFILDTAQKYGISAPLLLAIFWKESSLGSTAGPGYNLAGVGGAGNFTQYGSWEQAIEGAAANLATPTYKGKSVDEQIGSWYAGPERWAKYGRGATDAGDGSAPSPNGTVGDYVDRYVAPTYAGLGISVNTGARGTRKATSARGDDTFPVVGWQGDIQNHWGTSERGATDIMAPSGTPIVAVRGGRVTWAGSDGLGGNNVLIHDDASGLDFYYAHMRDAPLVRAGQTVTAGAPLGYVGNTGDAAGGPTHLHLGIGYGIIQGGGASGGAGKGFDAVGFLQSIYGRGRRGGGGGQLTP
jgi:murein DD-endopeptidase MepM/ murein hydrolase activator NlpD